MTRAAPLLLALAACAGGDLAAPDDVAAPLDCLPDLDGAITAAELPIALGQRAPYWESRDVAIDVTGAAWDLSEESPADELVEVGPAPLGERWYAAEFASGHFVLASSPGLEAVYHLDELGLWLHGLASVEPDPSGGRTLLVYDAPVPVLRLPLRAGDAWTAVGTVGDGTLNGLPYVGADTYTFAAVAAGPLAVPYVRFDPAIQVRTHVVARPAAGGVETSRRQVSFVFECFGEVARAESRADEPAEDFTTAAILRRFAL